MTRDVYITGAGIVSPIGVGKEAFLAGLRGGRSGIDAITGIDVEGFRVGRGGEVDDAALGGAGVDTEEQRGLALALTAAREAIAEAGLSGDTGWADAALSLGTGAGEMRAMERTLGPRLADLPLSHPDPLQPPSALTSKLAHSLGISGRQLTFINACAAGAQAIAVAADLVRSGRVEIALAGGVETLNRMVLSGFESLRAVSAGACRPFDGGREGIQLSELAAFVVLESGDRLSDGRVAARAVRPYARISGSGSSADAFHVVRPDEGGAGGELALQRALRDAGLDAGEIDYVNAHGTGTIPNDPAELAALRRVFGERAAGIPISSTKAMLGHGLAASGAAEAVICALAMRHRFLPPTINWQQPIPGYESYDFVPNVVREGVPLRNVVSSSFAFGGNNVVLVFSAPGRDAEQV